MDKKIFEIFMQYKEKYKNSEFYTFLESVNTKDEEKLRNIIKLLENEDIMKHLDLQRFDALINGIEREALIEYYKMLYDLVKEINIKEGKDPLFDLNNIDIKNEEKINQNLNFLYKRSVDYMMANHDKEIGSKYSKIAPNAKLISQKKHYKMLFDLISETYGKEAGNILLERPRIKLEDISSLYIFDSRIMDMIGYGGVHAFMNYDMKSARIIAEICQNPELIRYYKEFERITEDLFPPSAVGLEERLHMFVKYMNVVKLVVDSGEPEKYKNDLEAYIFYSNRLKYFDLIFENHTNVKDKFMKLFNLDALEDLYEFESKLDILLNELVEAEEISFYKMMFYRFLNSKSFEVNEKKFLEGYERNGSQAFNEDELDIIELLSIINYGFDEILNGLEKPEASIMLEYIDKAKNILYELIRNEGSQISSFKIIQIRKKIIEEYKAKYLKSLFSVENIAEKAQETEEKIAKGEEVDRHVRRVIKKKDGRLYFQDHIESMDGKIKIFTDYIDDGESKTREYIYENDKKIIRKDWQNENGKFIYYKIGEYAIMYIYSEEKKEYIFKGYSYNNKAVWTKDENADRLENIIRNSALIKQYNPNEQYKLEEGDIEIYWVNKVNAANLMLTVIRHGNLVVTSINLQGKITDEDDRLMIEKEFEGGQSTRSFYYHYKVGNNFPFDDVALAFTNINPNGIIGVYEGDAGTTHKLKQLVPSMMTMPITDIMDSTYQDGEIVTLRYEWNLNDIKPRNRRR